MTLWAHYLFIGTSSQWPPVDSRHTDIFGCRFFWGIWTHILELWNVEYSKAANQAPSIHPVSVVALPQNQVIFLDFENGKYTNNNRIWCFVHYPDNDDDGGWESPITWYRSIWNLFCRHLPIDDQKLGADALVGRINRSNFHATSLKCSTHRVCVFVFWLPLYVL